MSNKHFRDKLSTPYLYIQTSIDEGESATLHAISSKPSFALDSVPVQAHGFLIMPQES